MKCIKALVLAVFVAGCASATLDPETPAQRV